MYVSRVNVPLPPNPEQEDYFSSGLGTLFTDDVVNSHGVPGNSVTYASPRFGPIELRIPSHPDVDEGRRLFAHFLWNAAVIAADAIETASADVDADELLSREGRYGLCGDHNTGDSLVIFNWDKRYWNVRGKNVLELGAGTALPSLIAALSGARSTTITDHPSSPALMTGVIKSNVEMNITKPPGPSTASRSNAKIDIHGYIWGATTCYDSQGAGELSPALSQPKLLSFHRIVVADCLWMPSQHVNLVRTVLSYLRKPDHTLYRSDQGGEANSSDGDSDDVDPSLDCALVIAGFHTGRGIVADWVETATGSRDPEVDIEPPRAQPSDTAEYRVDGDHHRYIESTENGGDEGDEEDRAVRGSLRAAEIFEIDVNGQRRAWKSERPGENKDMAKGWCMCAVIVRR